MTTSTEKLFVRPSHIDEFLDARRPMVIAHRGFSGKAPENTLAAIRKAIEIGADMVEVDVTLTADGHVVVVHDEMLDRTTDGTGPVRASTLEDLRRLDAGAWFDARFAGEKIPTLSEVLELIKDRILLNIEIKPEVVTDRAQAGIAESVAELVRRHGAVDQVIVSCFDPRALRHLSELAPELRTASLYNRELHRHRRPSEITAEASSEMLNINHYYVRRAMLKDARRADLPIAVYTVNWPWHMRYTLYRGAHAIFTDRPDRMLELLRRRYAADMD